MAATTVETGYNSSLGKPHMWLKKIRYVCLVLWKQCLSPHLILGVHLSVSGACPRHPDTGCCCLSSSHSEREYCHGRRHPLELPDPKVSCQTRGAGSSSCNGLPGTGPGCVKGFSREGRILWKTGSSPARRWLAR